MIDRDLASRIRLVGFDVDGVLTDGGIYLGAAAGTQFEFKRYDIQDGLGMTFLRRAGIKVVVVTGRVSESVRMRCAELDVDELYQHPNAQKLGGFIDILARHGVGEEEAAFIGDDFPDLPILRRVALPVAVANAVPEVKAQARLILQGSGGRGAVREFCELLLGTRGEWERVWSSYVAERSTVQGADAGRGGDHG